jgi:hypothetical protein
MSWTLGASKSWSIGAIPVNPVGVIAPCVLGYPSSTETGRPATLFAENVILRGVQGPAQCSAGQPTSIVAFYNDEHAITLGVRRVNSHHRSLLGRSSPGVRARATPSAGSRARALLSDRFRIRR